MNHFTNMQNKHQTQESTRQSVMEHPHKHICTWRTRHKDPMGNVLACA